MKKCVSIAITLAVLFSAMILPMQVSAATTIKSGETVSDIVDNGKIEEYKVSVASSGKMTINISTSNFIILGIFDSNGKQIAPSTWSSTGSKKPILWSTNADWSGYYFGSSRQGYQDVKFVYSVKKGTYSIKVYGYAYSSSRFDMEVTAPTAKEEAKTDTKPTTAIMTISLKSGSSLQLGTELPSDVKATWKSSKESVATVSSSGKVTAVAKGSTTITATAGKTVLKIKVIVS